MEDKQKGRNMWSRIIQACWMMGWAILAAHAGEVPKPPVILEYINPEKFTDVSSTYHGPPNQSYLDQFSKHVMKKAAAYLADGEQLNIAVKDIDMAGGFEPWNTPSHDVRMIRHIYPPRIELNYQLKDAEGKVLDEGEVQLGDLNYQLRAVMNSSDAMRYEKSLMDDWLMQMFVDRAAGKND
ncbi:DUF3016 domain-containing protein [Methylobacillus sp. Pita1]|uniref:DUF3016 domain-containing protein n=1 Tax=Methylobacillus sp. Pita1 TaxID=3382642 RepID=UPI0038B5D8F2